MSTSPIGGFGSSTFGLSTASASISLEGSRFSSPTGRAKRGEKHRFALRPGRVRLFDTASEAAI
jgi:hypothetical protein